MIFEGALSTKAAIISSRRKVEKIYIEKNKNDRNTRFIIDRANRKNIPIVFTSREEIDALATGKTHGGIIAVVQERKYQNLKQVLKNKENSFICVLEGIEDPFNLGYALRSLYSAGCDGVILRKRDWTNCESVIIKSSAAASEYINWIESEDLAKDIAYCKSMGCCAFAASRKNASSYFDAKFNQPLVLAIGGEIRGLSTEVLKEMDLSIYIPYANDFKNSLNASSAVAALSFEIVRQRKG
ncbi:MAG: TrmH family RNA methyltransferase [Anaerorhabdus sp.]